MANFHTDQWIMEQVREHYNEGLSVLSCAPTVGIFYQGSGNYGLDYSGSDVDTKLITIPTLDDICFNKKPISTTHIRENEEHIDLKDIRLYFQCFRKQNINFLEILFTPYYLINKDYDEDWAKLIKYKEDIAHYDILTAAACLKGNLMDKYHALKHPYPNKREVLAQFGYDPKQLHHLVRYHEFAFRFLNGESYEDCLISKQSDYLISLKEGLYNLEKAEEVAGKYFIEAIEFIDSFRENNQDMSKNQEVDDLLNDIQASIIKKSITKELLQQC